MTIMVWDSIWSRKIAQELAASADFKFRWMGSTLTKSVWNGWIDPSATMLPECGRHKDYEVSEMVARRVNARVLERHANGENTSRSDIDELRRMLERDLRMFARDNRYPTIRHMCTPLWKAAKEQMKEERRASKKKRLR